MKTAILLSGHEILDAVCNYLTDKKLVENGPFHILWHRRKDDYTKNGGDGEFSFTVEMTQEAEPEIINNPNSKRLIEREES